MITPVLEKKYPIKNEASYAYIAGQNIEKAFHRIIKLFNNGNRVILKTDIYKFFDTVNQEVILEKLIFPELRDSSINDLL